MSVTTASDATQTAGTNHTRLAPRWWWAWPVVVFVLSRLVDALMIVVAARHQIALDGSIADYRTTSPTPAAPGYLGVATNWDAQWYWTIAQHGYPASLPMRGNLVWLNEWAFAPLYPLTVRGLMAVTGAGFAVTATVLTLVLSLVAVVLVHKLVAETAGPFPARATTLLLCTSMAAPVLQIAYTEGPALALVAAALLLLRRRRYGWTALTVLALGLPRHVVAPFLVVLAVHAALRRRREGRWDPRALATVVAGALTTAAWPVVAAVATGRATAFTDTQRAWRHHPATTGPFGLYSAFYEQSGVTGALVVALVSLVILWLVLRRDSPSWGPEVRAWAAAYPTYLLAVAPAATSLVRLMLLGFPLFWVLPQRQPTPAAQKVTVAVLALLGIALQWYWIRHFLVVGPASERFAMP